MTATAFLISELSNLPGRFNTMVRGVIASAVVVVLAMTLQVPFLALSLIVVFYVTQANITLSRLVGAMLMIGSTMAVGAAIGLLIFTFDYPLIRITSAGVLFFCSVYLMRVVKAGIVFFIVALVVIYVQSFVDLTDNAEELVRSCLWVWVSVNYAIAVSLLVNAWLLPQDPVAQLDAELKRQLALVDVALRNFALGKALGEIVNAQALQRGAVTTQKLLRFASMRDSNRALRDKGRLTLVTTVSRLLEASVALQNAAMTGNHAFIQDELAISGLRKDCDALMLAIANGRSYEGPWRDDTFQLASLQEMRRALNSLTVQTEDASRKTTALNVEPSSDPFIVADAWKNPIYTRFSLRTLLAVFLCYGLYNAVRWPGIHTIMLSCLICALPTSGASRLHGRLRLIGASIGSTLALITAVWIVPHVDGIVGLLSFSLPIVALGAWIAAGSERISYAGVQIMFTFSLSMLEQFTPVADLTEIRDRLVGILLGVGISTLLQMTLWPEGEGMLLRRRLSSLLHNVARLLPTDVQVDRAHNWLALDDCEAMLTRVTLEPSWNEGEQDRFSVLAQTLIIQTRSVMVAASALRVELAIEPVGGDVSAREEVLAFQRRASEAIESYAKGLETEPPAARRPANDQGVNWEHGANTMQSLLEAARRVDRELTGLPDWTDESVRVGRI